MAATFSPFHPVLKPTVWPAFYNFLNTNQSWKRECLVMIFTLITRKQWLAMFLWSIKINVLFARNPWKKLCLYFCDTDSLFLWREEQAMKVLWAISFGNFHDILYPWIATQNRNFRNDCKNSNIIFFKNVTYLLIQFP